MDNVIKFRGRNYKVIEEAEASKSNNPDVKKAYICEDAEGNREVILDVEIDKDGQNDSRNVGPKRSNSSSSKSKSAKSSKKDESKGNSSTS